MFISSVGFNNKIAFGTLYTNPDGSKVDVSDNAIRQARTTTYIRNKVNEAMKECPQEVLDKAINACSYDTKLYFTIDVNGKCVISNKEIPRIKYEGIIKSNDFALSNRRAYEICASKLPIGHEGDYSDEGGAIRSHGYSGYKFAHVLPDGQFKIDHPEWAPKDVEE